MEELNNRQLILLVLLVSFVTSIATGIITFTLLQEAPVEVTQTINRVVERTIEQVNPEGNGDTTVVREVQVVSEEDLVLESIDKTARSVARIRTIGSDGAEITAGLGIVVDESGVVVTDARIYSTNQNYSIVFSDGAKYAVSDIYQSGGFVFMKIGKAATDNYKAVKAELGNTGSLKLGQSVIAIGGKTQNTVSIGRITEVTADGEGNVSRVIADISSSRAQAGSPLINLSGQFVGIEGAVSEGQSTLSYVSISSVREGLNEALDQLN